MEKRVQVRKYMLDGCFQELVYLKVYFSNTKVKNRCLIHYIILYFSIIPQIVCWVHVKLVIK